MQKSLLVSAFVVAVATPAALLAQEPVPTQPTPAPVPTAPTTPQTDTVMERTAGGDVETNNVLTVARNAGNFTTLVKAIEAAGLAETLQGEGPFTIFAPTDEAFAKLPQGQLDALLADPAKLRVLLLGHVVPSKVTSADAASQGSATTVAGATVAIAKGDSSVKVGNANVVQADIAASNGVVHAVDAVILPAAAPAAPVVPPATPTDSAAPATPAVPTTGTPTVPPPAEVKSEAPAKSETPAKPETKQGETVPPASVPPVR